MRHFVFLLLLFVGSIPPSLFAQSEKPQRLNFQNVDWSPDGKYLAFSAIYVKADWSDFKPDNWQLILLNLKNGKSRVLANGAVFANFSPDGKSIAYSKHGEKSWNIEIQDLKAGNTRPLSQGQENDSAPSWSPDGRQLVFARRQDKISELYIVNWDGNELRKITDHAPYSAYNPVWAPTGNRIVYYVEKGDQHDQIYLTDSQGSFQKNLSADTLHNIYPSWTPKGDILYANKSELRMMDSAGASRRVVAGITTFFARVSRNGKKIAYFLKTDAGSQLVVQAFPKGKTKLLFDRAMYESQPYRVTAAPK